MSDDELIDFLAGLRHLLNDGGTLLLISASFLDDAVGYSFKARLKDVAKYFLDAMKIRPLGQFWGWLRTRQEYKAIMYQAGFSKLSDGFMATPHQHTYWIRGACL